MQQAADEQPEREEAKLAEPKKQDAQVVERNNEQEFTPPFAIPPTPPEIQELNAQQKEIAALSDQQILDEIKTLKAKIYQGDLIKRLNADKVSEDERKAANEILVRLSLLGVERSKRARGSAPQPSAKKAPGNDEGDVARLNEEGGQ